MANITKLLATAAIFTFLTASANASDDVYNAPQTDRSRSHDWTGLYLGGILGLGAKDIDTQTVVPNSLPASAIRPEPAELAVITGNNDGTDTGFSGGIQAGYNFQLGNVVAGIEADLSYVDFDDVSARTEILNVVGARTVDRVDMDYIATARARLGFAIDRALVYGTGGVAYTDATVSRALDWNFRDSCPGVQIPGIQASVVRCHTGNVDFDYGYVVGGGVEYAFFDNLSGKLEYTYTDFGSESFSTQNVGVPDQRLSHEVDLVVETVRFGMNFKFN